MRMIASALATIFVVSLTAPASTDKGGRQDIDAAERIARETINKLYEDAAVEMKVDPQLGVVPIAAHHRRTVEKPGRNTEQP